MWRYERHPPHRINVATLPCESQNTENACGPFWGRGELGPHVAKCGFGRGLPSYQVASWSIQQFGHDIHGPKNGGLCPFGEGELGPHLTQCGQGRGIPPYQVTSWSIQPFGHNRYGPKNGGLCPFGGGRAESPSNTTWPGQRPISTTSFILIHPTVWPQYTNVTDRTDRQDRTTVRYHRANRFTNGRPKTN